MITNHQLIAIREFAKSFHLIDATGHDWFHISRVVNVAKQIALAENVDVDGTRGRHRPARFRNRVHEHGGFGKRIHPFPLVQMPGVDRDF